MAEGAIIRWASASDHAQLGQVMFDAVHNGRSLYSAAQREAWVPKPRIGTDWDARLEGQVIVLQEEGGHIAGFMSLASHGYVDFAYIRPSAQGSGLFRRLYVHIEGAAISRGERRLWAHASLVAQPAFAAVGFTIVSKECVALSGQLFDRFEMEKVL